MRDEQTGPGEQSEPGDHAPRVEVGPDDGHAVLRPISPGTPGAPVRTGAEQAWEPEDLAEAKGQDPTPQNVDRARRELEREGPAAIEKTVP
jgi:hypothetical protein